MNGKIYRKTIGGTNQNKNLGYISKVVSPSGDVIVEYNHKAERIDLDTLSPYVGQIFEFYNDDELVDEYTLDGIDTNEDGIRFISITKVPRHMEMNYATE